MDYKVKSVTVRTADGSKVGYVAYAYQGVGVNFPVESEYTYDQAEAQGWADRANAGEDVPEAKWGSYSDD